VGFFVDNVPVVGFVNISDLSLTWTRAQLNGHLGKTNGKLYSQGRSTPER
jgi:hypothetical protein